MKMHLGWKYGNNTLVLLIATVGACIIIIAVFQGKSHNRFRFIGSRKQSYNPSVLSRHCKQLSRRESINWSYFYYYEDMKTKKSVVWCKVPKAASTTLTKMFLRVAGAKNVTDGTRIHKLLRQYYPRLSSKVMKHRIHDSKTFVVVRDPFERILSAYRDKLESYQRDLKFRDGYYYDHYGRFMVQPQPGINGTQVNSTRTEPTWNEFVQYLLKTSVARYDEHWMPMTRLCSPCSVDFNIVIKMEKFDQEIKKALSYAKINMSNLGWSHKTGTGKNRKIINSYFRNLTLSDVKKLYTKYKRDFQLFGYTPYKYFRLFGSPDSSDSTTSNVTKITEKSIYNERK